MNWQEYIKGKRKRRLVCNYLNMKGALRDKRKYRKIIRQISKELSVTTDFNVMPEYMKNNLISMSLLRRVTRHIEKLKVNKNEKFIFS